jgi:hypothetical protein
VKTQIKIIVKGKSEYLFGSTESVCGWLKSGGFTRKDTLLLIFWDGQCIYSKLNSKKTPSPRDLLEFFGAQ